MTIAAPMRTDARVCMAEFHSPSTMISPRQSADTSATRMPASTSEIATMAPMTSHHGDCSSRFDSGLMTCRVTVLKIQLVAVKKCSSIQALNVLTGSVTGRVQSSEKVLAHKNVRPW